MNFHVLTLFPEMFNSLKESIIGRAVENNLIEINLTKEDGSWKVLPLDKTTLEKIHGTYNYEQE